MGIKNAEVRSRPRNKGSQEKKISELFLCPICKQTSNFFPFEGDITLGIVHSHLLEEGEDSRTVMIILICSNCKSHLVITVNLTFVEGEVAEMLERAFHRVEKILTIKSVL